MSRMKILLDDEAKYLSKCLINEYLTSKGFRTDEYALDI